MESTRISTGSKPLDTLLNGGYEREVITTLFGESGSGKSNFCILATLKMARQTKKIVYVDTEGSFSVERAKQIEPQFEQIAKNIFFMNPTSFEEQKEVFEKLKQVTDVHKIGLVVVDSVGMLYRLKLGSDSEASQTNREFANQLCILSEIARKKKIPVLVTNQVYADFKNKDNVRMVSGDLIKYWSKCIVKLEKAGEAVCKATIFKHRSLGINSVFYEIYNGGVREASEPKKRFKLF